MSAEQSLFTYPEGLSADNFSHPDHIPDFLNEVLANADSRIHDLCQDNAQCIFDVYQTRNEEVGRATLQFEINTRQSEVEASKNFMISFVQMGNHQFERSLFSRTARWYFSWSCE